MGKIHIKGGSDLQVMFTDERGNSLGGVTLEPVRTDEAVQAANGQHWYKVKHGNGRIQAHKRNATPHVFRASGDMEVDFESTGA